MEIENLSAEDKYTPGLSTVHFTLMELLTPQGDRIARAWEKKKHLNSVVLGKSAQAISNVFVNHGRKM